MSIFSKAISRLYNTAKAAHGPFWEDLKRLEEFQRGLGKIAADYIAGTADERALAALGGVSCDFGVGENSGRFYTGKRTEDEAVNIRRRAFADGSLDAASTARYVEVLTATLPTTHRGYRIYKPDDTPLAFRVYLVELFHAYRTRPAGVTEGPIPAREKQSIARVLEVAADLGAGAEDLLASVFYQQRRYGWRNGGELNECIDVPALVRAEPQAFIALGKRLEQPGRENLFAFIEKRELAEGEPFFSMVLDGLGASAKAIREAALACFLQVPAETRERIAVELLGKGKVELRAMMAEVLIGIDSESARAALVAHLEGEKVARVRALIEGHLATAPDEAEDATSYLAMDGSRVGIPPVRSPEDGPVPEITDAFRAELLAVGQELEDLYQQALKDSKSGKIPESKAYYLKYAAPIAPEVFAEQVLKRLNGTPMDGSEPKDFMRRLGTPQTIALLQGHIDTLPPKPALELAVRMLRGRLDWRSYDRLDNFCSGIIKAWLASDGADFRWLETRARAAGARYVLPKGAGSREMKPGESLDLLFLRRRTRYDRDDEPLADEVLWPLVAENLWLIDRALGVVNEADYPENPEGALDALATLPKLPARTTAPLLALALSGPKALRKRARAMLERETGFEPQLIALIDDSRQEVRAGAARWLGGLGRAAGAEPLQKRLKKEKSQVVRAALLAALEALGQDISAHVGPAAFAAEARKGLARASFKDLGWLDFEHLPELHYRDGTRLPVDVLKWWCALAVKLKAPGETEPFELCLGQLAPEDAETLSTLLFDAWLAHDTAPPSEADVEAYAQARLARYKQGEFWVFENAPDNWDDAAMLDLLRRHKRAETPNSGAPSKGILALASKVPPGHAVARVKSYLKQHGRRTSQTTALLELMAAKGDAMSLQVVIAAATRLRQKGVQARANELVQEIADRNGWTRDELADRTVPTGGLDDDGRMELPCSEGTRLYTARLDEKLGLTLFNPDGKVVKSLPSGSDEATRASKKALSAARKEIKQAIAFQTGRLYEAMCIARDWTPADWQRDFLGHPLMRKLCERLIWQGLDADGTARAAFRPTPEGECIDAEDATIDPAGFARLRLAHGSTLTPDEAAAWRAHLADYEVTPLFDQVREDLPRLEEAMKEATEIDDRLGWVTDLFTLRGAATRAGYERGEALDGGSYEVFTRHFASAGILAVLNFTGSVMGDENHPVALKTMWFEPLPAGAGRGYGSRRKLPLGSLPPVLLAESWAALHGIAEKAAFDPEWEKLSPW